MRKLSYIVLGVIIGVALTASVGAYAASTGLIGKKVAGEIKVYLDGKEAPSKAIVVNNTSYLPVRWTANAAGLGLELKGKEVYLTNPTEGGNVPENNNNKIESQDIDAQIKGLQSQIDKLTVEGMPLVLISDKDPDAKKRALEIGDEIARLKAQIAELEAQLQAQQ